MRKLLLTLLAAAALAACTVERNDPAQDVPATPEIREDREFLLTATAEGSPDTRTVIQDETKVFWQPGDAVKLFFDGASGKFTSTNTEPAGVAQFSGTLNIVVGFNEGFSADRPLWGLYPWREDATADNTSVTTTLPAEQVGKAGSFAQNTYITLGRSESLTMGFWGVCGGLRFSLTQEGIRQVEFESLGGEPLAGRITLAFEDGVPVIREVTEGSTKLTLTAPGDEGFLPGHWYYIVALPGSLQQGFKLTLRKGSRIAEYVSDKPVTIKRSIFGTLAEVDRDMDFKIPGIGNPDDPIPFADAKLKAKLVAAFDRNGDGELSFNEADVVSSLKDVFGSERDFTSFDEFRFFTSIQEIPDLLFRNWTALSSIQLPENLQSIGTHAFYGCSSLGSITLPDGIRKISRYAFTGCSVLTECHLGTFTEEIGEWAFYNCSSLTDIILPESLTLLGDNAFRNCKALKTIWIPDTVTSLGKSLFYGCKALSSVRLPDSVTDIPDGFFSQCESLDEAPVSEQITAIGASAFFGCTGLETLVIPAGVLSIGQDAFNSCTSLTGISVQPAIPPTGGSGMFSNTGNCPIYVPASSSSAYTEALYWKDYATRMQAEGGGSPYYTSTDYSRDGEVVTLQSASVGRGVNFILLGDGFLDRDMDTDGKYEQRMRSAMESLFAYEPYRSERARFNVYTVKVISANAQYNSALSNRRLTYDSGSEISFRSSVAIQYALKAPNATGQPVKVAVLCNSSTRVGRSYCLRWTNGRACCILFDPNGNVLVHELCGHGFGDLWDEYTENGQTFTDTAGLDRDWEQRQWGANADWRNDPATVRWAHLLADSRYDGEDLGIFEGAKLYPKGIYRPSNNSMMRYNNCPFNAPSREQIYKNIMKWSVGSGWNYDYETFVALDAAGRTQAAGRLKAPPSPEAERELERQHAETHIPSILIDEDIREVGFPVSGPAVPHFVRK